MKKILFINSSPNEQGTTASFARTLLQGYPYDTLTLAQYRINTYGSTLPGDEFDQVLKQIQNCDILVLGSPVYWHNLSGALRVLMDRFYGPVAQNAFAHKDLYLLYQGAAPEKWMLEAGIYSIERFASMYGFRYQGCASYESELIPLRQTLVNSMQ